MQTTGSWAPGSCRPWLPALPDRQCLSVLGVSFPCRSLPPSPRRIWCSLVAPCVTKTCNLPEAALPAAGHTPGSCQRGRSTADSTWPGCPAAMQQAGQLPAPAPSRPAPMELLPCCSTCWCAQADSRLPLHVMGKGWTSISHAHAGVTHALSNRASAIRRLHAIALLHRHRWELNASWQTHASPAMTPALLALPQAPLTGNYALSMLRMRVLAA